ncbi:MAG TPA: double-strand break repair protein AddB, partial [Alphaproteobacteria bacterium]
MSQPTASVFSIPPHLPFAMELANGILKQYGDDFASLSQLEIFVPNRRSCRTLTEAFLAVRNGKPCLLPRIQPIGDVSEDDVMMGDIFGSDLRDVPPAIPTLERQMLLGRLIQQQRPTVPPAQIFRLAAQLANLIDHVHTENLDWDKIDSLVPAELAEHWQLTVDFLGILFKNWPLILAERRLIDPADRRNRLLKIKAETLRNQKNLHPVMAVGSTGSIPATRDLLKTIAYLPQGSVILSGLDHATPEEAWNNLPDTHPQFYLKELLGHIGVSRPQVVDWPHLTSDTKPAQRTALLQQTVQGTATLPPAKLTKQSLDGLSMAVAAQPQQEAKIIALKIREALEKPKQSVLLVTPDRTLARRVEAELGRWDIQVNDSAGRPLSDTQIGTWLHVTATMMQPDSQALALLTMLHHPFASLGYNTSDYRYSVTLFEKYILRGAPWRGGIHALAGITKDRLARTPEDHHTILNQMAAEITTLLQPAYVTAQHTLAGWLGLHLQIAEALASSDDVPGMDKIWAGEEGELAAESLRDLLAHAAHAPDIMNAQQYRDFIGAYLWQQTYRPRFPLHPRVNILGPIEARFQNADLMILSGLNETIWPREAPHDPFMSQPMRKSFGLTPFARRIGQAALDFYLLAHAPQVFITYSQSQNGAALAPARWLQQMDITLKQYDLPSLTDNPFWPSVASAMDQPQQIRNGDRPRFAPPLAARPRGLSVSDMALWRQDPYALYAKKILRLRPLDPPENEAAARDWGNVVHQLLEELSPQKPFPLERWHQRSHEIITSLALPAAIAMQWQQRLRNIGAWFAGQQD